MIIEDGFNVLFLDSDTEMRKFALAALFMKHLELVSQYKNSEITDIVSHASTKTLDANLVKKAYISIKMAIKTSAEFALKKARFI
jgi:hypothetical protein